MLLGGTLTMMVVSLLLMADSVIAGVTIGADAVAGIALVTPLYSFAAFIATIFSLSVPIVYSTSMGRFDKKEADRAFGLGLTMSMIGGIALFLFIALFGEAYLRSSSPLDGVLEQAGDYLYWMRFTVLLMPLQILMGEMVYADGDETLSTMASVVQAIGNTVFSILLSRSMGIRGIGFASFLFNLVSMLILCIHLLKKSNSLRPNIYFSGKLLIYLVRYSLVDSSTYLFLAVLTAGLNTFISRRFGAEYLILAAVVAFCREAQLVFDGIGEAVTPIITVYLGEECPKGVSTTYSLARRTAIVEGVVVTLLMIMGAPLVPRIMNITDPVIVSAAVRGIRLLALGNIFVALLYLLTSYHLLIERIAMGIATCAMRDMIFPLIFAFSLGWICGTNAMFAGLALAPAVAYLFLRLYVTCRYGRENWPIFGAKLSSAGQMECFELEVEPERIIEVQKKVEAMLIEADINKRVIGRVKLLIEELYMLIREKNQGKRILSECTVILRPDGVQIITKDDGVIFDISDEDVTVTSITNFAVSAYMEKLGQNKHYLTTMSFNRSSFLIRTDHNGEKI